uniref:NADH dehydrogenase subunit 6 n=1 Tax=Mecidea indica TaxID=3127717 RepID=UPI0030E1DE89
MSIMMSLMITMSLILMTLYHPLSMGLILIAQTIIIAMMVGYSMMSFLFAYIIIIIMLSGALVLFIYMASMASNEKFNFSIKVLFMSMMTMMLSTMYMYLYKNKMIEYNFSYEEISLIKIFNSNTSMITLMMIIYLLITMIAVSNIASVKEGPLRVNC